YALSSSWPKLLWRAFKDDGVDESISLGDLITRNLQTRMSPFSFSPEVISETQGNLNKEELRKVLGGERFLNRTGLHDASISPGDFFRLNDKFYINIRPDCDCVARDDTTIDQVNLYLLEAKELDERA